MGNVDKISWEGVAHIEHRRGGEIIWQEDQHNALTLEGANYMLGVFFNAVAAPAQTAWYGTLYTSARSTALTGAAAVTGELAGTGYARQQVTTWTLSQVTNWRVTTNAITFTAGATWTAVTDIAYMNTASGAATKCLSYIALSSARTLLNTDTLQVTYYIQLA
jgi:hypothetical protein